MEKTTMPTECEWCEERFTPPPTGSVYDLNTNKHYDDYWATELSPENYPDDYGNLNVLHVECYKQYRVEQRRSVNKSLRDYK